MNSADTFYVLDFDRTLADTDKFAEILEDVIASKTDIELESMREARAESERSGGSFDVGRYVREAFQAEGRDDEWTKLQREFIEKAQTEETLLPYAADLLNILAERGLPHGIITYGGEAWQLAKLEAANLLHVPHITTGILEKGELLTGWKQDDGTFVVPPALTREFAPLRVQSLVFLDDKAKSFTNIPEGVQGIFVTLPGAELLPSQQGTLPDGVRKVAGLREAIKLLFSK